MAGGELVGREVPALCAKLTHEFGREEPILATQHEPRRHSPAAPDPAAFPFLTEREREVVDLIARGLTNAAIAGRLYLSDKTVRNHVSNIFTKPHVTDRAAAVARAPGRGLRPGCPAVMGLRHMATTADRSRSGRPPHSLSRGVKSSVVTATGTR